MKVKDGQTWVLKDAHGGETVALVLDAEWDEDIVEVLILTSTLHDAIPGNTENFSLSWFSDNGSLLSQSKVR